MKSFLHYLYVARLPVKVRLQFLNRRGYADGRLFGDSHAIGELEKMRHEQSYINRR